MKRPTERRNPWGTIFLIVAAVGFGLFVFQPWWSQDSVRFFRAFFEASLVGALADWFAVTALFKRPLGLPIPHTNLLVTQKDSLVQALPKFLGSFLEPDHLVPVIKSVDWAQMLLDHADLASLDQLTEEGLQALWNSPEREAWEQRIITLAATVVHSQLTQHKDDLVGPITAIIKRRVGWKGFFIHRETVYEAVDGFLDELKTVRDRPDHGLRASLAAAFHTAWPQLVEQFKPSHWAAVPWKRLKSDPAFRLKFNQRASELFLTLWNRTGASAALTGGLGYVLAQTDARSLANRIEAAVRNDLQYIRVNGALVGGLAGLALELLKFSR